MDLYSAFRSEDTEALEALGAMQSWIACKNWRLQQLWACHTLRLQIARDCFIGSLLVSWVNCDQTAGWTKPPLCVGVGLGLEVSIMSDGVESSNKHSALIYACLFHGHNHMRSIKTLKISKQYWLYHFSFVKLCWYLKLQGDHLSGKAGKMKCQGIWQLSRKCQGFY